MQPTSCILLHCVAPINATLKYRYLGAACVKCVHASKAMPCPFSGLIGDLPEREREWHHVWHNLVECPARQRRHSALRHFAYIILNRLTEAPVAQARYAQVLENVVAQSKRPPGIAVVTLALKLDFLTLLVNPARYMPKGTHAAALRDVVNLITDDRPGYQAVSGSEGTSESDFDEDVYREALAALQTSEGTFKTSRRRRRKYAPATSRSAAMRSRTRAQTVPPSVPQSTPHHNSARGGRQITPLCPPRRRNRRRTVVADVPSGAIATYRSVLVYWPQRHLEARTPSAL